MARSYKFALLKLGAASPRDEKLNVGLAVFLDGTLDVRLPKSLSKINALSFAFDQATVRESANNLTALDAALSNPEDTLSERLARLRDLAPFQFSSISEFSAPNTETYEFQIESILRSFVEPEPMPKVSNLKRASKLATSMRSAFRAERILAKKGEDFSSHRLLTNYSLATGLVADFVLKNGAMHVIETVDATGDLTSPIRVIKDIALSALTIEQARISFGEEATIGRLVYSASAETEASASSALMAAEHQKIELINWASVEDQRKLLVTMTKLAEPLPRAGLGPLHASAQHRFDIN